MILPSTSVEKIVSRLSDEERLVLTTVFEEYEETGKSDLMDLLLGMVYDEVPVDMETFLYDPYFLGTAVGGNLYPTLADDLIEIFEGGPYIEVYLTGGIGYGKSTLAEIIMLRMVYECWCYKDPAAAFGLLPGSVISFVNVSVTEAQARNVIFKGLYQKLARSPFFQEKCYPDPKVITELRFPKNIWLAPVSSADSSTIGLDLWGGAIDEGNFMPVIERSKSALRSGETYDKAASIYNSMMSRMKSRFLMLGTLPGKLIMVSSKSYPDTFMERRIRDARANNEPNVFIRDYSTWGPKPPGTYSGEVFFVEVGDAVHGSRILGAEPTGATSKVIAVPVEFKPEFQRNLDEALRNHAGIATATINPYFRDFPKVLLAVDDRKHPFSKESTNFRDGADFLWETLIKMEGGKSSPLLNPESPRWVHIDPSLRGDATGFAMGHIAGLMEVKTRDSETERWKIEEAPLFVLDFMLRIHAPLGEDIEFSKVRGLIYELKEKGFKIHGVSMDSYQSAESLQHLASKGYQTEMFSVEKEDAYKLLKQAFGEKRVMMYYYQPAMEELRRLELDRKTMKVDHPPSGSKDVSDAICGVIVGLSRFITVHQQTPYEVRCF